MLLLPFVVKIIVFVRIMEWNDTGRLYRSETKAAFQFPRHLNLSMI